MAAYSEQAANSGKAKMKMGFLPFHKASSTSRGKKTATRYLQRNAAKRHSAVKAQLRFLLLCQAQANAHNPRAKKHIEPESRVAILETSTAGASTAITAAAASPVVLENTRLAKP